MARVQGKYGGMLGVESGMMVGDKTSGPSVTYSTAYIGSVDRRILRYFLSRTCNIDTQNFSKKLSKYSI